MVDGKKFGLSIICFEDCTHLFNICAELRSICDSICIIWQHKSYFGKDLENDVKECVEKELSFLKENRLIDEILVFTPPIDALCHEDVQFNELSKRKFAYELMCNKGMDYCLIVDSDEFNTAEGVKCGIRCLEKRKDKDALYCKIEVFVYDYDIVSTSELDENTYINFIQRCTDDYVCNFDLQNKLANHGYYCDLTRQFMINNFLLVNDYLMSHFSYIRNDLSNKAINYSQPHIVNIKESTSAYKDLNKEKILENKIFCAVNGLYIPIKQKQNDKLSKKLKTLNEFRQTLENHNG